jgi:hypothetical protein
LGKTPIPFVSQDVAPTGYGEVGHDVGIDMQGTACRRTGGKPHHRINKA